MLSTTARADDYFINTAGGDWSTISNWNENAQPNSGENAFLGYDIGGVTFANPSGVTVTDSGPSTKTIQSLFSKSNLTIQPPGSTSNAILILRGATLSFDSSVSINLAALNTATFASATLEMKPLTAGNDLVLNANINEGYLGEVAFGTPSAIQNSVTYGAGYTWNITSPTPGVGGNSTNAYSLDALEAPFILNGTLNMTNGSSALFGAPAVGSGAALTIGSTGKLILNASFFNANDVNNQGSMSLTGSDSAGDHSTAANFTNSGSFSAAGGATFTTVSNGGTNIVNNTGSISIDGASTDVLLENTTGNGSISVTNSGELDLESFNNSLIDHITVDSTGKVQIGGIVTTAAAGTFDFTRLGSHVSFGIIHGSSVVANGAVSFVGGKVIHSDQLNNVAGLTDVTLDHGLTTTSQPLNHQTVLGGTVNAGDKPMTVSDATTLAITSGATLNGDVDLLGASTLSIGGTLNGNVVNDGNGLIALTGSAKATSTITNNGTLFGQIENGELLSGSSLDFSASTQTALGSFSFDAGSSIVFGHEVDQHGAWSNAGTVTFAKDATYVPLVTNTQSITNTGTILLSPSVHLLVLEDTNFTPLTNSGTIAISGHWEDVDDSPLAVSNSGLVTIGAAGEVDQWNYSQSAGKLLVNGVFNFAANQSNPALGSATFTGGTLAGSGTIDRYHVSVGGGTIIAGDDGAPAGMKFIDSTLGLDSGATTEIQILDATHFGHFDFSGTGDSASLGGTLDVSLLPGAVYTYGESFTILTADQITGAFDTLDLPPGWQLHSMPTTISVIALPEPASLSLAVLATLALNRRRSVSQKTPSK
ncbi:MAG TPA: hypothetical protein VHS31_17075 [Tepidisphaeraceae bacterium]|nr:hypothetical protein [Tepidisphaeraceae bacterium]